MLTPGWGSSEVPWKVRPQSLRIHGLDPLFLMVKVQTPPNVGDTTGSPQKWTDIIGHWENLLNPVGMVSFGLGPNKIETVPKPKKNIIKFII